MSLSKPPKGQPSKQSSAFDKLAFVRHMKNIGRAYRKQAMELVSLCRTFVQAQEQSPDSDHDLRIALNAVDDALDSASEVKKRPPEEVDKKFATAIEVLGRYEEHYHPKRMASNGTHVKTICEKMEAAKAKDKSTSKVLNVLKEACQKFTSRQPETMTVEFHLFESLPDKRPTIVRQVLDQESTIQEVLWNFSRFKDERRLTLKQNPHFYKDSDLPESQEAYVGEFRTDPVENFQHTKICVLTDKPGRVFLETDKDTTRAFGNVWVPNKAIIFKDVCGKLEGENIVQKSIQDASNLWYLEELPLSLPASPNSPSSTMTPSPTNSASNGSFKDWREPIHGVICRGMISLETNICIRAVPPPSNSSPSPLSPSSPTTSPGFRPTAVPRRLPVSRLSPRTPAPPYPNVSSVALPHQPSMTAVPVINPAMPASAASIAPTSNGVSQRRESQRAIPRGEAPKLLKTPGMGGLLSPPTVISLSAVTGSHRPHTAAKEPRRCGKTSGQADTCCPAKGTASLVSDSEATGAPPRMRGTQLSQSVVWQFWNRMCNLAS